MATFNYKTWESINLPSVSGDTYFLILDHYTSDNPSQETSGIIYNGFVLDGFQLQNLNEILSQYINPTSIVFDAPTVQVDETSYMEFFVYYTQDGWDNWTYDTIKLFYDWGYNGDRYLLSDPIINIVDYRQFLLNSRRSENPLSETTINVYLEQTQIDTFQISGTSTYNYVLALSGLTYPGEFSYAYSYDFLVERDSPLPNTYNVILVGDTKYLVTNTCYNYCLYYINQYGGWDSLLFRGRELQTDDLTRLSYKQNYVANSTDFCKVDYLTTIKERWSLNTSFLADNESLKLINVMASNKLYLQDLNTGHISPVNITNSNCEFKTYKNQGRKMATYEIEVAASQPKYRI